MSHYPARAGAEDGFSTRQALFIVSMRRDATFAL
jgi:hypothetical protein